MDFFRISALYFYARISFFHSSSFSRFFFLFLFTFTTFIPFFLNCFPSFSHFFSICLWQEKSIFPPREKKSRVSDTDFKLRFDIKKEWKFDRLVQPYRGKDVNIKTGTHVETLKKELGK